jgi:hypothetical protein
MLRATLCAQRVATQVQQRVETACCNNVLQQYVVRENSFVMIQLTISSIATPCSDGHITQCSYPDSVSPPSLAELCHPTRHSNDTACYANAPPMYPTRHGIARATASTLDAMQRRTCGRIITDRKTYFAGFCPPHTSHSSFLCAAITA